MLLNRLFTFFQVAWFTIQWIHLGPYHYFLFFFFWKDFTLFLYCCGNFPFQRLTMLLHRCSTWIFAVSQQTPLPVTTIPRLIWFWCSFCHGGVIIFHSYKSPLMKSAQSSIFGWFPRKNLLATSNFPFKNVYQLNSISISGNLSLQIPSFSDFHCWISGIFLCYRRLRPIEGL